MDRDLAEYVVAAASVYAAIGVAVGLAFLLRGIERFDPAAIGAHAFRPLLLPGLALLWPLVLARWLGAPAPDRQAGQRGQRAAHRMIWLGLSVVLPAILFAALLARQGAAPEAPPIRLAPP